MKNVVLPVLAMSAAVLLAACGGDSGSPATDGAGAAAAPWVRYAASWRGSRFESSQPPTPATLTLAPVAGEGAISANAVARVEARLGEAAPVVLTAPNSTDGGGHPRYVFTFGQLAEAPNCTGFFPTLPVRITVTDVTGFAFAKNVATCVFLGDMDFGAFSDYGSTSARFSYEATAPITAFASRKSPSGYVDELVPMARSSFSESLPSADGDMLMLLTDPGAPVPAGTEVTLRLDGGGGSFAESTSVATSAAAPNVLAAFVTLDCCGPRPASTDAAAVLLRTHGVANLIAYPPDATYTYKFTITEPESGSVIGSQADTIIGDAAFPLQVRRGQAIELEVTPNDPRISVRAEAQLGGQTRGDSAQVSSNKVGTPARFKIYCCSP